MERKATFAVKNSKPNSSSHNSRKSIPKYLIETDADFDKNFYGRVKHYKNDSQFRELSKKIYKQKIRQKMQSKQIKALIKETVITASIKHTADDIVKLFDSLRKKMGGGYHLLELAGHFDEGHFERTEDGWENLTYYPSKDILFRDGTWYIKSNELSEVSSDEDFNVPVDMSNFKKVYNIHWHAKFTHINLKTGKTARFTKGQVSGEGRLKYVAEFLELKYAPKEKTKRGQSVGSIKDQHHAKRQEKYQQIIDKQMIKMENHMALEESKLMLEASRADHREDSNAAFLIDVEYGIAKRENKWLEEYQEELEHDILVHTKSYNDLLQEINKLTKLLGLEEVKSASDLKEITSKDFETLLKSEGKGEIILSNKREKEYIAMDNIYSDDEIQLIKR